MVAPRRTNRLAALFDITCARAFVIMFLVLALPAVLGTAILTGPFQALDESTQFYRAVQISNGRVLPVVAQDGKSAGDDLDTSLHRLCRYFLHLSYIDWWKSFGAAARTCGPRGGSA